MHRFLVLGREIVRWVHGEPRYARHDDAHAEDAAYAVVVHYTGERDIVVHVLLADPSVCRRGVLDWLVDDADRVVPPFSGQREVPFLEVRVDNLRESEDREGFLLEGGVVRGFGERVGARADVGEVDADEGEAVCGVFFRDGGCEPACGAGEGVDGLGSLDARCDLRALTTDGVAGKLSYHHCSHGAENVVAHGIVELVRPSQFRQCDCAVDVVAPRCDGIIRAHDGLFAVSLCSRWVYAKRMKTTGDLAEVMSRLTSYKEKSKVANTLSSDLAREGFFRS